MNDDVKGAGAQRLARLGLHFCRHYQNLVKYNPEFCGKCPHNGLRRLTTPSETCF